MIKKILGLVFIFVFLAMPAFAEPISQEILDQARAQAGLFMDLKNALGLDWLDEYNAYLDNPTSSPEPSWASSVAELVGKNYLSDAFPDDFSITPSGQEVTISRTITSQGIKDALPIYLPSVAISGDTASLLVQRPVQWVSWEAALASKVSRAGDDDPDILPGASLEFGSGSEIEFTSGDGKLVGISSLSYKGEELEDRFVNAAGDNMTGPLTIEGNKVWHAGNDGSGSGLDADLLDGQHGSYYLAAGNLTGIVPVARLSGTYNIDISGRASVASEADNADTLDGKHAGAFALSGHTHGYVSKEGDTMTGVLTAPEYRLNDANTRIYEGGNNSVRIQTDSGYVEIGPRNQSWAHFQTDRDKFYFNKPVNAVDELRVYNTSTYLTGSTGYIGGKRILTTDDIDDMGAGKIKRLISVKTYNSPGNYTYTKSPGVTHIEVFVSGAGGGGAYVKPGGNGKNGTNSTFGSYITCYGGKGATKSSDGAHGSSSGGWSMTAGFGVPAPNSHRGGYGGVPPHSNTHKGGNGGYAWRWINVTNISPISFTVGRGGKAGYYLSAPPAGDGQHGLVVIKEYMDY
jgi:hypothetical protein